MYNTFIATLTPMVNMFLLIAAGYILRKLNILPENSGNILSKLETYLLVPSVSLYTMLTFGSTEAYSSHMPTILYATLAVALSIGVALPLSQAFMPTDEYKRGIYKYALTFANYGFMGNAIVPYILGGDEHLFNYILYTIPLAIITNTWGFSQLIPKDKNKSSLLRILNPSTVALILGLFLSITGLSRFIPAAAKDAVESLKQCMGPIAMVLTGYVLAGYSFTDLLLNKKVYAATFLRLFILPAFLIIVLKIFGADSYTLTLTLFAFATPLGLNTVVFPAAYGADTKTGASMAMISHILSVISIPIMYMVFSHFIK